MSYAASLLANYPSSYGPSTLLSDNLVQRTSFDTHYPSNVPFLSEDPLFSDSLAFSQLNYHPTTTTTTTTYRPSLYPTSVYPTTNKQYSKPLAINQHRTVPPNDSFASLNDITEYSDSLATASNTNTASSVARSIDGNPKTKFSNYNHLPSKEYESPQNQSIWSPAKAKAKKPQESNNNNKKSSAEQSDDDRTPVPSSQPKQPSNLQRNATITESNQQTPSIDIEAWLNHTKKDSPVDDQLAEQAWSNKMGHLHQMKVQHEKDKAKAARALPIPQKKIETMPIMTKTKQPMNEKKPRDSTYQVPYETYFDSIFDGDYFRKPLSTDHPLKSSLPKTISRKTKPTTNSFNNQNPKHVPEKKVPQYEPPTVKRTQPAITTSSWRKNWPHQYQFDSVYPYYLHNEINHRDFAHKDAEERYREALQKLRAERAEQQQKEINEKTVKRLNYGDYVRRSTKEGSLQNPVKPSPWSDFMHLKKGNIYTISKEEKKQLYNQSKNYGERVRYRNFALQHATETNRSNRHSVPLSDDSQGSDSDEATPRAPVSKSITRVSQRPDSAEMLKNRSKSNDTRNGTNRLNQSNSRAVQRRRSDNGYEIHSDYGSQHTSKPKTKKKTVRYAKFDSSGRTTSDNDSGNESDNQSQRNLQPKNHGSNEDLFTVREEKTLETIENSRYKKR